MLLRILLVPPPHSSCRRHYAPPQVTVPCCRRSRTIDDGDIEQQRGPPNSSVIDELPPQPSAAANMDKKETFAVRKIAWDEVRSLTGNIRSLTGNITGSVIGEGRIQHRVSGEVTRFNDPRSFQSPAPPPARQNPRTSSPEPPPWV